MEKNTQQPVAWRNAVKLLVSEYWDIAYREGKTGSNFADQANDVLRRIDEYLSAPPVPRDVLVKALDDMMYHCACQWSNSDPDKMVELCRDDIERIADCYASKVQPEPIAPYVIDALVGNDGGRKQQPEPVNQQLLAALKRLLECYKMADHHDGYCCCGSPMSTHDDPMNCGHCATDAGEYSAGLVIKEMEADIAAAEAAQPVGQHAGKFFTWDDETGFDLFDTKEEAKKAAQESIDLYRDLADCDGWPEAVENVCWGVVLGKTLEVELPVEGNPHAQLLSRNHYVDYVLTDVQQPASAQPVAVPDEWHEAATVALRFIEANAGHDQLCGVFDLDDEGRHKTCTCGMEDATQKLRALLSAAQKPDEMTPAMMRAVQLRTELGAYTAANLSGAYDLFAEFWRVALEEAKKGGAA